MTIVASMSALAWVFIGADIVPLVLGHACRPRGVEPGAPDRGAHRVRAVQRRLS